MSHTQKKTLPFNLYSSRHKTAASEWSDLRAQGFESLGSGTCVLWVHILTKLISNCAMIVDKDQSRGVEGAWIASITGDAKARGLSRAEWVHIDSEKIEQNVLCICSLVASIFKTECAFEVVPSNLKL